MNYRKKYNIKILACFMLLLAMLGLKYYNVSFPANNQITKRKLVIGVLSQQDSKKLSRHELTDFDLIMAKFIAKKLQLIPNFVNLTHHDLSLQLNSGKVDLVIINQNYSDQIYHNLEQTIPYYFGEVAVLLPYDSEIDGLYDLHNKKLGVQLDSILDLWSNHSVHINNLIQTNSRSQLLEALLARKLDGVIIEHQTAIDWCKFNPGLKYILIDQTISGSIMVVKKNSTLLPKINSILKSLNQQFAFTRSKDELIDQLLETEINDNN